MKRNHTTKRVPRSGISPYKRHGKKPFQYSPRYAEWKRAAMTGQFKELGQ